MTTDRFLCGRLAAFLIVTACFGSGCRSVTVDVVSTFIFETNVKTEANEALGGVTVSFVDTGLDARRAKRKSELKVGVTDSGGRLSTRWEYLWGYRKRVWQEAPATPGTFLVTLRHEKYETIEKSFRLAELPRAGREYVVTLTVQMKERVDAGGKSHSPLLTRGGMVGVTTYDYADRRLLHLGLTNTRQPRWNWPNYGQKNCGACFREFMHADGQWPFYQCPLP